MAKTLLLYGSSGTYKTTQCGEFVEYLYARYGKPVRVLTGDSGYGPLMKQVREGKALVWDITNVPLVFGVIMKVAEGWWPTRLANGIGDPESMALAPDIMDACSGIVCEGLTRFAELLGPHFAAKPDTATHKNGAKGSINLVEHGQESVTPNVGTYGAVQVATQRYVKKFKALPLPWVMFTAHENKGKDDISKLPVLGVAVMGQAITGLVTGWVETSLHTEPYIYATKTKSGKEVKKTGVRAYFTLHPDSDMPHMTWPAKLGIEPAAAAKVWEKWEDGFIPFTMDAKGVQTSGIWDFLQLIDEVAEMEEVQENDGTDSGV
jgi:hypothetical protein